MALEGNNIAIIEKIMCDNWPTNGSKKKRLCILADTSVNWITKPEQEKADAAFELLNFIDSDDMGKGLFAQLLADTLVPASSSFAIPDYITVAVKWSCSLT